MKNEKGAYIRSMRCYTDTTFSVGRIYVERNSLDESPTYQRESAIWSIDKKQLFIDSLINGYDIPKIYFHDLRDDRKNIKSYAIIDGKQRLYTIYEFLSDGFALADDFKINGDDAKLQHAKSGQIFKELTPEDKERFKGITLPIVLIQNATEEDIEDLFFRLNNGEPLNAAEKRNARGGAINDLIRDLAVNDFFKIKLRFKNKRYAHYEVAAKFLLLEKADMDNKEIFSDLKKKYLDALVEQNKSLNKAAKEALFRRVENNLSIMNKIFLNNDPLLSKQSTPPLYYVFVKLIRSNYGHANLNSYIRSFLELFEVRRQENLMIAEDDRDPTLINFGRLMQQGTNDISSLKDRIAILRRYFLLEFPDVSLLDSKRAFSVEERHAIYILSGKKCKACGMEFKETAEMEADHLHRYCTEFAFSYNNRKVSQYDKFNFALRNCESRLKYKNLILKARQ